MTDTNVTIKGKRGCSDTGITEELATRLFNSSKSTSLVAIVEFTTDYTHEATDGSKRTVDLTITSVEPVVDGKLNGELVEHVREIQQALFRNRKLAEGGSEQLPFDEHDGPAPKVADIVQQGGAFLDHDDEGPTLHQPDGDQGDTPDEDTDEPVALDPEDPEMTNNPANQDANAAAAEVAFSDA